MTKLPNDFSESIVQLSDDQFKKLDRECGRIVDLPLCYHVLTAGQVEELHSDDWSYYQDLVEEERCIVEEAREEFEPKPQVGSQQWAETYGDDLGESPDY